MALAEARAAARRGEVPVGAVVLAPGGTVAARAGNRTRELADPTAHAEILALRAACAAAGSPRLPGHALYVTLEPCAMCAAAIAAARIARLVYAAPDPKSGGVAHGARVFSHPQSHHAPELLDGIGSAESLALLRMFFNGLRDDARISHPASPLTPVDWTRAIDGYCERVGPAFWAEPVNAATNLAFILAALVLWPRTRGLPLGRALCTVLAAIGAGSFLFHTVATVWASVADVAPIGAFILLYLYAANRTFWRLPVWGALLGAALFVPYAAATVPLWSRVPGLGSSAGYMPVPVLIFAYAVALRRRAPATARGMALAGGLLLASLAFRTLDGPLCPVWPLGTHFVWHLLNGLLLGILIEVWRRRALAAPAARG